MITKLKLVITCLFLSLLAARSHAALEQVISSVNGSNIQPLPAGGFGYSIMAEDQLRTYMLTNPGWPCRFGIRQARTNVVLRFDESAGIYINSNWSLTVTYDINLYNNSSGTPYQTLANETAVINYVAGAGSYVDKFVKTYENAYRAELTIKSISYTEGSATYTVLPTNRGKDIFMDLVQETERYYNLYYTPNCGTPTAPALTVKNKSPWFIAQSTMPDIQLPLAWNYIEGAESYDVEWLFIDVGVQTNTQGDYGGMYLVDWRNATRINTKQQFYKIPLAYSKGYVVFRVRPVGVTHIAPFLERTEGQWSASTASGWVNNMVPLNNSDYLIAFEGLDPTYNWQYAAAYAEDGKRKEVINYFDGSLRNRQTGTMLNTDGTAVIAETKYDFQGRPSVHMLPTPAPTSSGLHYYSDFNTFGKQNFDIDANFPVANATVPATHPTGNYYGNNVNASGQDALLPNAKGFPYAQTLYKKDGTGRVQAQSAAGDTLRLGSKHETKYYYGTPSGQEELDRLFGIEVGNVSHYKKNLVLDPNGQVSVAYLDQEGRTIATALSGSPVWRNLLPLDDRPAPTIFTTDMLTGKNNLVNDARISKTTLLIEAPGKSYQFVYRLNQTQACDTPCVTVPYCRNCAFDFQFRVTDENGLLIPASVSAANVSYPSPVPAGVTPGSTITPGLAQIVATDIVTATYTVNIVFPDIGAYVVEKSLTINYGQLDQYAADYVTAFLLCDTPKVILPPPCNDCDYLCKKQHTRYDAFGHIVYKNPPLNTIPVYTNINGVEIPVPPNDPAFTQYDLNGKALIAQCINNCDHVGDVAPIDECAMRKLAMVKDMSPGGQYFDNMQNAFPACVNTYTCPNPVAGSGTDDWLILKISPDEASAGNNLFWGYFRDFVTNYNLQYPAGTPNHLTCLSPQLLPAYPNLSWSWMRANWQPCFAQFLVRYHPEYCVYAYFCDNDRILCRKDVGGGPGASLGSSKLFDKNMQSGTAAQYYNPASASGLANNTFSNPNAATVNSFGQYVSDLGTTPGYSGPSSTLDPYLSNKDCPQTCAAGNQYAPLDVMTKYLDNYATAMDCPSCYSGSTVVTNTCTTCATIPMSIWYLLDDPHNIAQNGENALAIAFPSNPALASIKLDPNTVSMFRQYHGYGSTPGLLAQTSKFAIFKAVYAGYKQIIFAAGLEGTGCKYLEPDPQEPTAANCCHSLPHAQIRFLQDPVTKQMLSKCPPDVGNLNALDFLADAQNHPTPSECESTCDSYADGWMNEIASKAALCGVTLNPGDSADMRAYLVSICAANCNAGQPIGASSGTVTVAPGFQSFTDVYNYYFNNASQFPGYVCVSAAGDINIVHPPQNYSQAVCTCNGLRDLAQQNNASWNDPNIASILRSLMINNLNVNPNDVDLSDVQAWISTCNDQSPDIQVLLDHNGHTVPQVLLCPSADSTYAPPGPCEQAQQDATYQTTVYQAQFFETLKNDYRNDYKNKCLKNVLSKESLLAYYSLDEYAYTLYYYDQAGNLIKTVPPKGVVPLTVSTATGGTTQDVANYRKGTYTEGVWPAHSYITNYKYNSLEGTTKQTSPDGGQTKYWYDALGRLVASQNAKQLGTLQYSYTLYDKLSRIIEVGELTNTTILTDSIARDRLPSLSYAAWLNAGTNRHQITRTWYDEMPATTSLTPRGQSLYNAGQLSNLRMRVASVTYLDEPSQTSYPYDNAMHYRYDMHGNVSTLFRENPNLIGYNYDVSRIDYNYDIISGKVNEVHSNPGKLDEFHHKYYYDADNRVVAVYTSKDGLIWEKDAKYFFYKHGPLLRTEIGDREVQASDYAYTINGWIKGVNSNMASSANDIGKDGLSATNNLNRYFGVDGYGYTLGYYTGDYISKNASAGSSFIASIPGALLSGTNSAAPLYNGNISHMATTVKNPTGYAAMPQLRGFVYDQLNRLRWSSTINTLNNNNNSWSGSAYLNDYKEEFHYDLNGNIKSVNRNGTGSTSMDALVYNYTASTNKISYVSDGISPGAYPDDIDSQNAGNYGYDATGNLTQDTQQNTSIVWNSYGRIKSITKPSANQSDLEFRYDGNGNRIEKILKPRNASGTLTGANVSTYYVHDVQGNVLAVYEGSTAGGFKLVEQDVFGSSRLGLTNGLATRIDANSLITELSNFNSTTNSWTAFGTSANIAWQGDGTARVQSTFQNTGVEKTIGTSARTSYQVCFEAGIAGVPAYNISVQVIDVASGQLINNPIPVTDGYNTIYFTAWNSSTKLRFLNTSSSGIQCTLVLDNIYVKQRNKQRTLGNKQYELSNHLGNVLTTVTDRRMQGANSGGNVAYYQPQIVAATDYYSFGAPMPGRNFNNTYRYGFNGQEKDNEVAGTGNINTAYCWEYDTRLGRRWNEDPKPNASISNYATFANNPLINTDVLGDTTAIYTTAGDYIGTLNDNLKNQVHFLDKNKVNIEIAQQLIEDGNKLAPEKRNFWADKVRQTSIAFMGENTIKGLKEIALKSAKLNEGMGLELGFYSEILPSREIIIKAFTMPSKEAIAAEGEEWGSHRFPMSAVRKYYSAHGGKDFLLSGHTHAADYYKAEYAFTGSVPEIKNTREGIFNNYKTPSSKFTSTDGSGGDVEGSDKNKPNLIAFPNGVTIYKGGQYKNNAYYYNWFSR